MDDAQKKGILQYFNNVVREYPDMSAAVAAIKTLLHFIENNRLETLAGLRAILKDAINTLTQTDSSVTSISSGCELFLRFITLTSLEDNDFQKCQTIMVQRGNTFLEKLASSRQKIARQADKFIRDGSRILIHSHSRVVQQVIKDAALSNKRFEVFVTESRPNDAGLKTQEELEACGVPTTLVLDSAVGHRDGQ
ncbi:EI2BA-like protein [Mya arenaria]|uniref:Translation initiation factor eIF2B subunit alpha n=1 Tax=Mya arenaria TaxID=6604 RepID=A0ABY7E7A1_MYAAR|nr:EI2BA-like protein [Mya arenaria]